MSLPRDLGIAVIFILTILLWQLVAINLLGPNSRLFVLLTGADPAADGLHIQERAEFWYWIAVWAAPIIGYFICFSFPIVRAYRRQAVTARRLP